MKRSIKQWVECNPQAMAEEQSTAAIQFAFEDAKSDIAELHVKLKEAMWLLMQIAYPPRNSAIAAMTIQDFAEAISKVWTLEELSNP